MSIIKLSVDRNLVCAHFNDYELSSDPVPVFQEYLDEDPSERDPAYLTHSRLLEDLVKRHNLLSADPWKRHSTYFINVKHQVMQCIYDPQLGHSLGRRVVYTVEQFDHGDGHSQMSGDYNYSMCFISEGFCVICDGISTYHLLDTSDRSRISTDQWQLVTRTPVDKESGSRGYFMYDARLDVVQERKQISLVAGHVVHRETRMDYVDLVWAQWAFNQDTNEWKYTIRQRLQTTGSLQYCAFEPLAESLVLASNRKIETREEAEAGHDVAIAEDAENYLVGTYTWKQSDDDLEFTFPLPETATIDDITIRCTATTLEVIYLEQVLLTGEMFLPVRPHTLFSEVYASALHMVLNKQTLQHRWPQLLKVNDNNGFEDEINGVEDDDEPPSTDENNKIVRFNLTKNKITHTILLGSQPLLFVTDIRPGFPAAFVTRQGMDASVWLQVYQPSQPDEWSVRHVGQLNAMGHVQASKENHKFTACCPEFKYSVICESPRNVFVYHSRHESAEQPTGGLLAWMRQLLSSPVGKQTLITLDTLHDDILGVATAENLITILTPIALIRLEI